MGGTAVGFVADACDAVGVAEQRSLACFVSEQETPLLQVTAKISSAATTTRAAVLITSFSLCPGQWRGREPAPSRRVARTSPASRNDPRGAPVSGGLSLHHAGTPGRIRRPRPGVSLGVSRWPKALSRTVSCSSRKQVRFIRQPTRDAVAAST